MKEFFGNFGGRTLFNEDLEALRDLGLSFHHIFEDFGGNFIISGCSVIKNITSQSVTTKITAGYVWLDGKVRSVKEQTFDSNITTVYIIPFNSNGKSIKYATNGVSGFMAINYGTQIVTSQPDNGNYIKCNYTDKSNRIINKFYDKYVLSKGQNKQSVNSEIGFNKNTYVKKLSLNNGISASFTLDTDGALCIAVSQNNMLKYTYVISDGIVILGPNNELLEDFKNNGCASEITLPSIYTNSVKYQQIKASNLFVNGAEINKLLRYKYSIDWTNLEYIDGTKVLSLFARRDDLLIRIEGTLPINDEKFIINEKHYIYVENSYCQAYSTNIKLPSTIPSPSNKTYFPIIGGGKMDNNISYLLSFNGTDRTIVILAYKVNGKTPGFLPSSININFSYYFA